MENTKVLVADHSKTCNRPMEYYLQHVGIEEKNITMVTDWAEALEIAQQELFDIIILSPYKLWMDPVKIATEIKSQYTEKTPKIIEFTSGALGHKPNEVFDNVVFKPTTEEIFAEKLLETLCMSRAGE